MWKRWICLALSVGLCAAIGGSSISSSPALPTWSPPTLDDVRAQLDGLDWRPFVQTSYRLYLLRFPEAVTRMGMADALGVRNDRLNDYSDAYVRETLSIEAEILARLRSFDRSALSAADRRIYDACEWTWDDLVRGHPFVECDYPVSHLPVTSLDLVTQELLTEIHPLNEREDAEDYVLRLEALGGQIDQIVAALERRAAAGVIVPRGPLDWALYGVQKTAAGTAAASPLVLRLRDALPNIADVPPSDAASLLQRAETAIARGALPATRRLASALASLRSRAPDVGIWRAPGGAAAYDYLIRHYTGIEMTAADVHELGRREVERVQAEVRAAASALGYPADSLSIAELFGRVQADGGVLIDDAILAEYDRLIERAHENALAFLPALPATDVVVEPDPYGGFYRSAPRDGSRPAVFGAQTSGALPRFTMPTLAYHETIPGHHVQLALAQEMDLPLVLSETAFLGFTEGWALYAERLAWEAGWYDDDAYGNLGRLQYELMRAARLVVDTGMHALGWTYVEASAYYEGATGRSAALTQSDLYRYAVWPAQAVSYGVGYVALLELRARAESELGAQFDLMAFHGALLACGNAPLGLVETWVAEDGYGHVDAARTMP